MTKLFKLLGVAILATLPMTALSATKTATCEIYTSDDSYKGKCLFKSEKGGSFSIKKPKGEILEGISNINVYVVKKRRCRSSWLNLRRHQLQLGIGGAFVIRQSLLDW